MRIAVAALCVLALTGSASADYVLRGQFRAPCNQQPPAWARVESTIPYSVNVLPQASVQHICAHGAKLYQPITACAFTKPGKGGDYPIYISDFLSKTDFACVLTYEKAHLPPSNWKDQAWEDAAFKGTAY